MHLYEEVASVTEEQTLLNNILMWDATYLNLDVPCRIYILGHKKKIIILGFIKGVFYSEISHCFLLHGMRIHSVRLGL